MKRVQITGYIDLTELEWKKLWDDSSIHLVLPENTGISEGEPEAEYCQEMWIDPSRSNLEWFCPEKNIRCKIS